MKARALLLVLDSVGVGHAPDAADYGDSGANTVGHILRHRPATLLPTLRSIGLDTALALAAGKPAPNPPRGSAGVLIETAAGKDTTTGHWELAGATLTEPFPVYESFPAGMVSEIESESGVRFTANIACSGTTVLDRFGEEHIRTGRLILYSSADSVMQIAAHEDVVPLERLYEVCRIARKHAGRIGRVIARPFVGHPGAWKRTPHRHDFSLTPPRTVLNTLTDAKIPVTGVGKISDIFAGSGITSSHPTASNQHGMDVVSGLWKSGTDGLIFANLVDFDMLFGHRRDPDGYALALEEFDAWLAGFLPQITPEELVIITADHGNDPTWTGTDHTRECVPVFLPGDEPGDSLGRIEGFGFVANRIAAHFGVSNDWSAASAST